MFNESFANFAGSRGAEQFFRSRGGSAAADEVVARWKDEKLLGRFWGALYDRVDSAFKARPGDEPEASAARVAARDAIFAEARQQLIHEVGPQLHTIGPQALERTRFDNAVLMSRRVYLTDLDAFDRVLARNGGDLRRAIAAIIAAAKSDREHPFDAVKRLAQVSDTARRSP